MAQINRRLLETFTIDELRLIESIDTEYYLKDFVEYQLTANKI